MIDSAIVTLPGLIDPVHQSQEIFRMILTAMSEPGRILDLPFRPERGLSASAAALGVLLTLTDADTPTWLGRDNNPAVAAYLRFHTGAPIVAEPQAAQFAWVGDARSYRPLGQFDQGHEDFPDRSATVVIEVGALAEGGPIRLTGPGIPEHRYLSIQGLPERFAADWAENRMHFPCGVDIIFTCGTLISGLPRGISLEWSCT